MFFVFFSLCNRICNLLINFIFRFVSFYVFSFYFSLIELTSLNVRFVRVSFLVCIERLCDFFTTARPPPWSQIRLNFGVNFFCSLTVFWRLIGGDTTTSWNGNNSQRLENVYYTTRVQKYTKYNEFWKKYKRTYYQTT